MQDIYGITLATFNSNISYTNAFKETVAESMDGVESNNIVNLIVTSIQSAALRAGPRSLSLDDVVTYITIDLSSGSSHLRSGSRMLQTNEGINTNYNVRINQPGISATGLVSQLNASVSSGQFNTRLQSNAKKLGATGMVNSTSSGIEATILIEPESGSSNSDKLHRADIAGIVIGCFAFAVMVLFGVLYYTRYLPKNVLRMVDEWFVVCFGDRSSAYSDKHDFTTSDVYAEDLTGQGNIRTPEKPGKKSPTTENPIAGKSPIVSKAGKASNLDSISTTNSEGRRTGYGASYQQSPKKPSQTDEFGGTNQNDSSLLDNL